MARRRSPASVQLPSSSTTHGRSADRGVPCRSTHSRSRDRHAGGYIADDVIATAVFLAISLEKPILIEGRPAWARLRSRRRSTTS